MDMSNQERVRRHTSQGQLPAVACHVGYKKLPKILLSRALTLSGAVEAILGGALNARQLNDEAANEMANMFFDFHLIILSAEF